MDADIVGVAPDEEVNRGSSDTEVVDGDLLEKRRQKRIRKAHLGRMAAHRQAQTGLEQEKDGRGGPGLRGAGDGVQGRPFARPPREAAKQLREAVEINEQAGIEQAGQDLENRLTQPITAESIRRERIVVRPD
jgi:hypothetical protein